MPHLSRLNITPVLIEAGTRTLRDVSCLIIYVVAWGKQTSCPLWSATSRVVYHVHVLSAYYEEPEVFALRL